MIETKIQIPKKLNPIFADHGKRFVIIHGGRGSGKSWGVAYRIILHAMEGKRCACCREISSAIDESMKKLLCNTIERMGVIDQFKVTDKMIRHASGGHIFFKGLKGGSKMETRTRIKSLEAIEIAWLEEAEGVNADTIKRYSQTIRTKGNIQYYTFNRYSESDPVWNEFCKKPDDDTMVLKICYYDNPFLDEKEREKADRLKTTDYNAWLHYYDGEPVSQSDRALISRERVKAAFDRKVEPVGPIRVGADIARYGDDKTVFSKVQGFKHLCDVTYSKQDLMTTTRKLHEFGQNAIIKVDDTGVGSGVSDRLREFGANYVPVNFGSRAMQYHKYYNKISEFWFNFNDILDSCDLIANDDLFVDLTERRWELEKDGRRRIESKENFKKRVGRSPDRADALLLAFSNEQSPVSVGKIIGL